MDWPGIDNFEIYLQYASACHIFLLKVNYTSSQHLGKMRSFERQKNQNLVFVFKTSIFALIVLVVNMD